MRTFALRPTLVASIAVLLLGGCGGVVLDNPLSDRQTTQVDERLIGFWELEAKSVGEEDPEPGQLWPRIAVGRKKGDDRAMEAVALEIEDDHVVVRRLDVWPTLIAGRHYLSIRNPEEKKHEWLVVRYAILDDGRMEAHVMDVGLCAASVDEGEVKGEVLSPDRGHEVVTTSVHIQASTTEARAWIESHGDDLFGEKGATLRRLVKRDEDDEEAGAPDEEDEEGEEDDVR